MATPTDIIFARRVRLLELADEFGNVSEACRTMGISRTRYYQWKRIADAYGLEALMPKQRRRPQQPNETPTHVVADLLAVVVVEPTIGCRQLADRLDELGYEISKSTVQRILVAHGLGQRHQRVARAAAVATLAGLITEPVTEQAAEPFGFCHWAAQPGDLVAVDSFYIGNLKGVGKVYQLTAVDTCTRWAIVKLIIGPVTAAHTIAFIDHLRKVMRRLGIPLRNVLSDNGPEYVARAFQDHLAEVGIGHVRIPPRSPNHNAVVERFQGTMLQECWRPAFHRRRFTSLRQLQAEADTWLTRYNTRRRNHSHYMAGRRPIDILDNHRTNQAA
ncbi:MAG: DDE-type integrase/transposase/recombinase [Acidimicrobiales bacterium]